MEYCRKVRLTPIEGDKSIKESEVNIKTIETDKKSDKVQIKKRTKPKQKGKLKLAKKFKWDCLLN